MKLKIIILITIIVIFGFFSAYTPPNYDNITFQLNESTPPNFTNINLVFNNFSYTSDSCTYSSGNWNINCSDNCVISSNVNLGNNNMIFSGSGTFTLNSNVNITNINQIQLSSGCEIILNSGSNLII